VTGRRVVRALVSCGLCTLLLTACGKGRAEERAADAALAGFGATPYSFVYTQVSMGGAIAVTGTVDDPYRYAVRLFVNGTAVWDEVVVDDAVADRFDDPAEAVAYLSAGKTLSSPTTQGQATALGALQARQWVLDNDGAPPLPQQSPTTRADTDPFYEPLTMAGYALQAVDTATAVELWSPSSLSPTYNPDPFPAAGVGEDRYDLVRAAFPQAGNFLASSRPPPGLAALRELAIYVHAGHLTAIREDVNILARLPELVRDYALDIPSGLTAGAQTALAQGFIDRLDRRTGAAPIEARQVTFTVLGPGAPVNLPTGAISADLGLLAYQGATANPSLPNS